MTSKVTYWSLPSKCGSFPSYKRVNEQWDASSGLFSSMAENLQLSSAEQSRDVQVDVHQGPPIPGSLECLTRFFRKCWPLGTLCCVGRTLVPWPGVVVELMDEDNVLQMVEEPGHLRGRFLAWNHLEKTWKFAPSGAWGGPTLRKLSDLGSNCHQNTTFDSE